MKLPLKTFTRAVLITSLLSLALTACGDNTATSLPAPGISTTAAAISTGTTAIPPAASITTAPGMAGSTPAAVTSTTASPTGAGNGVQVLTDLGKNLTDTAEALKKNDLAAARAAYKKFDTGWLDVEGVVQQASRDLYKEIEDAMTPVGRELLRNASTTAATVTPLVQTLQDKFAGAIKSFGSSKPAAASAEAISGAEVVAATTRVDNYLKGSLDKLVTETAAFVAAVKSHDLVKAKTAYQKARYEYESIEFLAETFKDSDVAIDARPDAYPKGENDPAWTGFHPLEKAIWVDGKLDAATDKLADKLLADVNVLHGQVKALKIEPEAAIAGAAELLEEIQSGKITGEEERYSHTDFNDFKGNFASARFVYEAYSPFVKQRNAALDSEIRAAFTTVETALVPYFAADGTAVDYTKLNTADRKTLAQKVEALADSFSRVSGTLGLNK